jgi:phage tail-like protein
VRQTRAEEGFDLVKHAAVMMICAVLGAGCGATSGEGSSEATSAALAATPIARIDTSTIQRFSVEIDGITIGGVQSVAGFSSAGDVIEYQDGDDGVMRTRPGQHTPGTIVLTRDASAVSWLDGLFAATDTTATERKSVSILFYNDAGEEAGRLSLTDCVTSGWQGSIAAAKSSGHATESLVATCGGTARTGTVPAAAAQ